MPTTVRGLARDARAEMGSRLRIRDPGRIRLAIPPNIDRSIEPIFGTGKPRQILDAVAQLRREIEQRVEHAFGVRAFQRRGSFLSLRNACLQVEIALDDSV